MAIMNPIMSYVYPLIGPTCWSVFSEYTFPSSDAMNNDPPDTDGDAVILPPNKKYPGSYDQYEFPVNLFSIIMSPDEVPTAMLFPNIAGVPFMLLPVSTSHFLSPSLMSSEYSFPLLLPMNSDASFWSIDGEDPTSDPMLYDHTLYPSLALIAYNCPSSDPTYTFPFANAGDECILSPVAKCQISFPVFLFIA